MNHVSPEFYWVAVAAVTIMSVARITRLLTYDQFPPILYFRDKISEAGDKTALGRKWALLAVCGYCMSFWVALVVIAWGYFAGVFENPMTPAGSDFPWFAAWWLVNSVFGSAYLGAIVMKHDGDV